MYEISRYDSQRLFRPFLPDLHMPGGGSVRLTAAQGIGLVGMVAALTIGKERYRF